MVRVSFLYFAARNSVLGAASRINDDENWCPDVDSLRVSLSVSFILCVAHSTIYIYIYIYISCPLCMFVPTDGLFSFDEIHVEQRNASVYFKIPFRCMILFHVVIFSMCHAAMYNREYKYICIYA